MIGPSHGTVIGLLSGGKDSLCALHCCVHFGFEIEVIGHIRPKSLEKYKLTLIMTTLVSFGSIVLTEEADSYMYQSVGSHFIEDIARCLGVPLVIKELSGLPKATESIRYSMTHGDEVEDLYELLNSIKIKYPNVKFVSTGAILSDYQRNRVEDVCRRLNLISLAFLWKFQQHVLLDIMSNTPELEARIIKVASMGLNGSELGKDLKELAPKFHQLEKEFGFHSCGEGGEFESITLNSPLFKNEKIEVKEWTIVTHSDDAFAPVLYIHPKFSNSIRVVPKTNRNYMTTTHNVALFKPLLNVDNLSYYFNDVFGSSLEEFLNLATSRRKLSITYRLNQIQQVKEVTLNYSGMDQWSQYLIANNAFGVDIYTNELTTSSFMIDNPNLLSRVFPSLDTMELSNACKILSIDESFSTLPSPASVSLWRPYDLQQLPGGIISNESGVVVTSWLNGCIPHNCKTITAKDLPRIDGQLNSQTLVFIVQLGFVFRNLRNYLFDLNRGLNNIQKLDIMVYRDVSRELLSRLNAEKNQECSVRNDNSDDMVKNCLMNFIGWLWLSNFGDKSSKEAYKEYQQREAQLWNNSELNYIPNCNESFNVTLCEISIHLCPFMPMKQMVILRGVISNE